MKAKEVALETLSSRLHAADQSSSRSESSVQRAHMKKSKRGRPKSERKQLDQQLFKKLKKGEEQGAEVHRLPFQQEKFEQFQNGELTDEANTLCIAQLCFPIHQEQASLQLCLVSWHLNLLNGGEAGGDLVLLQTFLPFMWKSCYSHANKPVVIII